MKKSVILTTLVCLTFLSFGSANMHGQIVSLAAISNDALYEIEERTSADLQKACPVKFELEFSDGTVMKGELVFFDVSWWDCTKMQIASWWQRTF